MASALDTKNGEFKRRDASFRNFISKDPSNPFQPEAGRYHLYVSIACPWAHRTMILRNLKGLQQIISLTIVDSKLDFSKGNGWTFTPESPDPVNGYAGVKEIYLSSDPNYSGRFTVPILYDKKTKTIVNNESSEIIVMFNHVFDDLLEKTSASVDLYPESLRTNIDQVNQWVYNQVNNGVYRCGFATTQEAYDAAFDELFDGLDKLENILAKSRYLTGDRLTLSDIRLFTTLVRFEPVYFAHFKCNKKRLIDYPNLWSFTRDLYQMPLIKSTVNIEEYKIHYYWSQTTINPTRVVPKGPAQLLEQMEVPHDRTRSY